MLVDVWSTSLMCIIVCVDINMSVCGVCVLPTYSRKLFVCVVV